jgi:hypothetical protein
VKAGLVGNRQERAHIFKKIARMEKKTSPMHVQCHCEP